MTATTSTTGSSIPRRFIRCPEMATLNRAATACTSTAARGFPTSSFHATNYWVDVVFALTLNDAIPPVISAIKATTIDSSKVTVSWLTNEDTKWRLDYGTDPNILTDDDSAARHALGDEQHVCHPAQGDAHGAAAEHDLLLPITAIDRSGNSTVATPPTFTVPGPTLRDTASTDFAAGTGTGTYVSETADGEVILSPSIGSEFSGPTLPAGWIAVPWSPSGYCEDRRRRPRGGRRARRDVCDRHQWRLPPGRNDDLHAFGGVHTRRTRLSSRRGSRAARSSTPASA